MILIVSSAEVSKDIQMYFHRVVESFYWNSDVFKARDVDLEVICVEDCANIEITV